MEKNKPSGLDKIGALLKQMGISEESTKEFLVVCESWYNDKKAELHKEYETRLDRAKKVCVEEVEAHKASLSRGIQMFLESEQEQISKAAEKHMAIAESEAVRTLKKVSNLLNGLDIDSAVNAQALQAESKKNAKLTADIVTLKESLAKEKAKGAKMADLAEKSIARQKQLETEIDRSKKLLGEAKEQLLDKKRTTISEHKQKAATPKTTYEQKVVVESKADSSIDLIAESM